MGGRGSFIDVNAGNFTFRDGGQTFLTKQEIAGVKIIEKINGDSVSAPMYSHTVNNIYGIIQNGKLKYLTFYDENHQQIRSIDLQHPHEGLIPHVHISLNHRGPADAPTNEEIDLIARIKKEGHYK